MDINVLEEIRLKLWAGVYTSEFAIQRQRGADADRVAGPGVFVDTEQTLEQCEERARVVAGRAVRSFDREVDAAKRRIIVDSARRNAPRKPAPAPASKPASAPAPRVQAPPPAAASVPIEALPGPAPDPVVPSTTIPATLRPSPHEHCGLCHHTGEGHDSESPYRCLHQGCGCARFEDEIPF